MKTYKLSAKYLTTNVSMMTAIVGCLYDAICLQDQYELSNEKILTTFNSLMEMLKFCCKLSLNPYEELKENYDSIEFLDTAAHINKIDEYIKKICEYIKEPIQIIINDYPKYIDKDILFEFVPNFSETQVKIYK